MNDLIEFIVKYLQNLNDKVFNNFGACFVNKKVSGVMLKDFISLKERDSITDMIFIMLEHRVNELPVVDEDKKIIGEVNRMEFIKFLSDNEHLTEVVK